MKYYLSSYGLGTTKENLKQMFDKKNSKFGYIPNALDFTGADLNRKALHIENDMNELHDLGVDVELLDLKNYFVNKDDLHKKLSELNGVYVSGGNVFILRQAMYLSGFDQILISMKDNENFLYIAYSAGVCVLSPTLKYYVITDDYKDFPYKELSEQIWDGVSLLNFVFEPHYQSNHPESEGVEKEVKMLIQDKLLFKAYKDGETLILK